MDFISSRASESQPWALHVSYLKPHAPFLAPEPFNELYHPSEVELPAARAASFEKEAGLHPFLAAAFARDTHFPLVTGGCGPLVTDDIDLRLLTCSYYALISELDANIGRLLAHLSATGQDANTVVIFTSDHGELLGEHWLRGKLGFHDGAYRIPLIIRDPRVPSTKGAVVHAFTEAVDIAPSIMDCFGLKCPTQFEGVSLMSFIYDIASNLHGWR